MTSAYLEQLGRGKLESPDISQTNYDNVEDTDMVSSVNDQIEENARLMDRETDRMIAYYNAAAQRKSSQFQALADITTQGVKVAQFATDLVQTERELNRIVKDRQTGRATGTEEQDEYEEKFDEQRKEGVKVNSNLEKEKAPLVDRHNAQSLFGFTYTEADTRAEMRDLMTKFYPAFRARAETQKFWIPDGKGGKKYISMKDVLSTDPNAQRDLDYLDIEIDKLFATYVKGLGLSKGQMRKYIYRPMMEQGEARSKTRADALETTLKALTEDTNDELLLSRITSKTEKIVNGELVTVTGAEFKAVLADIDRRYAVGSITWREARKKTFESLTRLVDSGKLDLSVVEELGNFTFKDHNGKEQVLREYWKDDYAVLLNKARKKFTGEVKNKLESYNAQKLDYAQSLIDPYKNKSISFSEAKELVNTYREKYKFGRVPEILLNIWNDASKTNEEHVQRLEWMHRNHQLITMADVNKIKDDHELWLKWKARTGLGLDTANTATMNNHVNLVVSQHLSLRFGPSYAKTNPVEYANVQKHAERAYGQGFGDWMKLNPEDYEGAHAAGQKAMAARLAESFGPISADGKSFEGKGNDQMLGSFGSKEAETKNNNTRSIINQAVTAKNMVNKGELNINSTQPWNLANGISEQTHLDAALAWLKDPTKNDPPEFYKRYAQGNKDSWRNIMVKRLLATGMIKESEAAKYLDNSPDVLKYKADNSTTYMYFTEKGEDIAEVLDLVAVNEDSGGFNAVVGTYKEYKGKKPTEMTIGELQTFFKENPSATIGMYNLSGKQIYSILNNAGVKIDANTKFDETFQNALILHALRANVSTSKQFNTSDNTFMNPVTKESISPDDLVLYQNFEKEWNEANNIIGETPFNQLWQLIPIAATARVEQVMGN